MMMKPTAGLLALAMLVSACATEGAIDRATGLPMTEVQRAQKNCRTAIASAAVLGAIAGAAASNRRNAGQGALIGGAAGGLVGAGFCGVMLAVANEKDRQKIAELQRASLDSGQAQTASYQGEDGRVRQIDVQVQDVPDPVAAAVPASGTAAPEAPRLCRRQNVSFQVATKGSASLKPEIFCRTSDGDWKPVIASATPARRSTAG